MAKAFEHSPIATRNVTGVNTADGPIAISQATMMLASFGFSAIIVPWPVST